MDRRQKKSREAIFTAFSELLGEKSYNKITVQEIIDEANVGRTTFYAHFESKDALLRELCEELFGHIVASARDRTHTHGLYSNASAPSSVFCHLLQHLRENDKNIVSLLSCESSEIFLRYFKNSLNELVESEFAAHADGGRREVPRDFLINHISGSFVEMVQWWVAHGMERTPEELDCYFCAVIEPVI